MKKALLLGTLALLLIPASTAHLAGGEDVTKQGYTIDLGYEPETLRAGGKASFKLSLVNASSNEPVSYESAWIRITRGEEIIFSGTLSPTMSSVTFSTTLHESGDYNVTTRFQNENTLTEHTFRIHAEGGHHAEGEQEMLGPEDEEKPLEDYDAGVWFFVGETVLLVIAVIAYLVARKKVKKLE